MNVIIVNYCVSNLKLLSYGWQLLTLQNFHIFTVIKINYYNCNHLMKVHDYMFGVYFLDFIIMCIFLFKLTISICKCFCHIDDFTIYLWRLNIIQYVENKMWWKIELPYLTTIPHVIFVDCDLVAIIYWQSPSSIPITLGV